jgi:signal transduction histidine kinase
MAVVAVALLMGAFLQVRVIEDNLVDAAEASAEARVADLAARTRVGDLPDTLVVADDDDQFVQVVDAAGRSVAASENVETAGPVVDLAPGMTEADEDDDEIAEVEARAATFSSVPLEDGGRWRVVSTRVATPDGPLTLYAGSSLAEVESTLATLRRSLLIGGPILVAIVGLVTLAVVRRALRPVDVMRADLGEITTRHLDRRVAEPASDDEIARLAQAMNDLLDRLEASVVRERRFVGDASHELRSPIASLRTQLDVALAHPDRTDWEATVRDALGSTERIEALASDLLVLAQVDAGRPAGPEELVDLGELVAGELEHRPRADGVQLRTQLEPDALVRGRANQLGRLLRNLLDNAQRHARSSVTVRVGSTDGSVVLAVADDGPGIPAAARERVFERFTRLDAARGRDAGGAGLGLAIVREVARAHGGDVEIGATPGPPGTAGATVTVALPRAARD